MIIIAIEINNGIVFFNRGLAKVNLYDYRGAILDCDKALEFNPKWADVFSLRGDMKLVIKDKEGACVDWSKAGALGRADAYDKIKKNCN